MIQPEPNKTVQEIIRLYKEKLSSNDIARELGISQKKVCSTLHDAGIELRGRLEAQRIYIQRHGSFQGRILKQNEIERGER